MSENIMCEISYTQAIDFILPKHYAGRKPQISKAFGWFEDDVLCAVCSFGKPASPSLCRGICGDEWSSHVYELNRLIRVEGFTKQLSEFVAWCLKQLKELDWIVVSYADTGMHHTGYVYQACNFMYTGKTVGRTDKYTEGNKHSRHYGDVDNSIRKVRTEKHRYVYFCTKSKKTRNMWKNALRYPILNAYPKEENQNYILGDFQKATLVYKEDNGGDSDYD